MSRVTNVILPAHVGAGSEINSVNKILREKEDSYGQFIKRLSRRLNSHT
jgi:hypothetical protein